MMSLPAAAGNDLLIGPATGDETTYMLHLATEPQDVIRDEKPNHPLRATRRQGGVGPGSRAGGYRGPRIADDHDSLHARMPAPRHPHPWGQEPLFDEQLLSLQRSSTSISKYGTEWILARRLAPVFRGCASSMTASTSRLQDQVTGLRRRRNETWSLIAATRADTLSVGGRSANDRIEEINPVS